MDITYFDHISATPLHPRVKQAIIDYIEKDGFGNPLSQHRVETQLLKSLKTHVHR